jgi:hypothetical protein
MSKFLKTTARSRIMITAAALVLLLVANILPVTKQSPGLCNVACYADKTTQFGFPLAYFKTTKVICSDPITDGYCDAYKDAAQQKSFRIQALVVDLAVAGAVIIGLTALLKWWKKK